MLVSCVPKNVVFSLDHENIFILASQSYIYIQLLHWNTLFFFLTFFLENTFFLATLFFWQTHYTGGFADNDKNRATTESMCPGIEFTSKQLDGTSVLDVCADGTNCNMKLDVGTVPYPGSVQYTLKFKNAAGYDERF